jgi:hypothetical protein
VVLKLLLAVVYILVHSDWPWPVTPNISTWFSSWC